MLSAISYTVFVCLFDHEPLRRSEYFPCCVKEAPEGMSLADDQSGAEEDGGNCIRESGDILYTAEEDLELNVSVYEGTAMKVALEIHRSKIFL